MPLRLVKLDKTNRFFPHFFIPGLLFTLITCFVILFKNCRVLSFCAAEKVPAECGGPENRQRAETGNIMIRAPTRVTMNADCIKLLNVESQSTFPQGGDDSDRRTTTRARGDFNPRPRKGDDRLELKPAGGGGTSAFCRIFVSGLVRSANSTAPRRFSPSHCARRNAPKQSTQHSSPFLTRGRGERPHLLKNFPNFLYILPIEND